LKAELQNPAGRLAHVLIDQTILNKYSFESTRSIAETLDIADSTVLLHLHDSICFRLFHLHWVLHLLMYDLRGKRKEYTEAMLPFLHVAKCDSWHHLVTGDESWFLLNTSSRPM
jgi:hypothetical protein